MLITMAMNNQVQSDNACSLANLVVKICVCVFYLTYIYKKALKL